MTRRVTRDRIVHAFDKANQPVLDLEPGEVVTLETLDAFNGRVTSGDEDPDGIDTTKANPATGPLRVVGAEPGDVLAVDILDMRLQDQGATIVLTGSTALRDRFQTSQIKIIPVRDGHAILANDVRVPVHPMIGVIGVA
ncbi:MAG TPA: acetamidase/formamidase family protein, partial [Nonomuraea sp.]|nr:acetamidase/formamidase family protein [Nonomuraea sp.]